MTVGLGWKSQATMGPRKMDMVKKRLKKVAKKECHEKIFRPIKVINGSPIESVAPVETRTRIKTRQIAEVMITLMKRRTIVCG